MTGFVYSPKYLEHLTGPGHPERPERVAAIAAHLEKTGLMKELASIPPREAELEWIETVHPREHIESVRAACEQAPLYLDPDTPVSRRSYEIARLAVGGVLAACDAVMEGRVRNAFCAVRPPGHHAETAKAMGFCLFNNVAVAARYLQRRHGLKRVLIVDWDVHHGNGTQEIFARDESVFYYSTHQWPYYPGTGAREENSSHVLNDPMASGKGDEDYLRAFEQDLAPAARAFRPDFILISAGFDAHADDPLAEMRVTTEGYGRLTDLVCGLAEELCAGRLVSALEGGYDLNALSASVACHLERLSDTSAPPQRSP